jgi:hypothetical protein
VAAEPIVEVPVLPALPTTPISRAKQYSMEVRARRAARWQAVHERFGAGHTQRQIARELGIARMTVQRLLNTPLPSVTPSSEVCPSEPSEPGSLSSPLLTAVPGVSPNALAGGLLEHSPTPPRGGGTGLHGEPIPHVPCTGPVAWPASATTTRRRTTSPWWAAETSQTAQLALALSPATATTRS